VEAATTLLAIVVVGAVGLTLAILNGYEVAIWACAYLLLSAIDTFADAMLYSMNAMTAYGSSGLDLLPSLDADGGGQRPVAL